MKTKIQDPKQPEGYRVVNLNRRKATAERCLNCSEFIPSERAGCEITDCELFRYQIGTEKHSSDPRNRGIGAYCGVNFKCGKVGKWRTVPLQIVLYMHLGNQHQTGASLLMANPANMNPGLISQFQKQEEPCDK